MILDELQDDAFYDGMKKQQQQHDDDDDDGLDYNDESKDNNDDDDAAANDELLLWDEYSLTELLASVPYDDDDEDDDDDDDDNLDSGNSAAAIWRAETTLEQALLQGVVPVSAGVGSECLPGDYGFDPLQLATKDYFFQTQRWLLNLIPGGSSSASSSGAGGAVAGDIDDEEEDVDTKQQQQQQQSSPSPPRPHALILRDYREAEIRHGRLAMLAAIFWPLQEMLDRLLLDEDLFGPLIYGPVTLPYFPLVMTAIMMLLGYLDIYSQAIKQRDYIGEAFLPGDCFWDPLRMLEGAPDRMKRNMQERELFVSTPVCFAFMEEYYPHSLTLPAVSIFLHAYRMAVLPCWPLQRISGKKAILIYH